MTTPKDLAAKDRTADDRAARLREAIRKKKAARGAPTESPGPGGEAAEKITPRPPDEPARLGPMQRSLWLAHRLDPESATYHLVDAFRVRGEFDVAALEPAFHRVVRRHRMLRSAFRIVGDDVQRDVVQVVLPTDEVEQRFGVDIVQAADSEDSETVAVREARRPFDLTEPPLVRLVVIEADDRPAILMLALHHILADEHALGVFWQEMSRAASEDLPAQPPQIQYDDHVHWLWNQDPERNQAQLDEWRRRLDPLPDGLDLPFEADPGIAQDAGRLLAQRLPSEILDGVQRLARRASATPFLVLAFAYRILLTRYSEGRSVAFASPVSTRYQAATAEMIGYFTNPVVMPTVLDETKSLRAALDEFRADAVERLGRASIPFQELVEEIDPPRVGRRHPLFQTLFVLRRPGAPPSLGRLEPLTLDLGVSKFDLTLFVTEMGTGTDDLELAVEYRADRYREDGVRRFMSHYEALLKNLVAADPERPVRDVAMMGPDEARRLADYAQGPGLTRDLPLLPRQAAGVLKTSDEEPAVIFAGRTTSYAEMDETARRLAVRLAANVAGDAPDFHVGLFLPRSLHVIAAVVGIHRAGAAYVPLDPTYPAERNRAVLADAGVAAVVTTRDLANRLPDGPWQVVTLEEVAGEPEGDDSATSEPEPSIGGRDPAYLLYTSGSTGRPKGVVVTHENLRVSTAARLQAYGELGVRPGRFLLLPSLAFDSSVAGLFWCLALQKEARRDALVLPTDDEARDPRALVGVIEHDRVTSLLCVPSLYAEILRFAEIQRVDDGTDPLRSLDAVIVAGESCPGTLVQSHFERHPGVRLFNEYGPTEATVWATLHEITRDDIEPVPIGRPIPGVRVDVEDTHGRPVPVGLPGHAWIAGETVADGYRGRPDLTAERFEVGADGRRRYRTGDRMAWTEDGRLLFLGREDEQIKLRGFRIEPGEVESALLGLPDVERAAVVARSVGVDGGSQQLVAFARAESLPADWRPRLLERLPAHMVPSRLVTLDELPELPNGKVDRRRLREMPLAGKIVGQAPSIAPATVPGTSPSSVSNSRISNDTEQTLLSLWQGLLGQEVGLADNFFELGGHSLQVAEMALSIERDLGLRVAAADVFQHPTVERLAHHLRRLRSEGAGHRDPYEHLFPIQPRGRGAPCLVCVPHFFSGMLAERFRGERPVYGLRGVSLRQEGNLGRWPTMRHLAEDLVREVERRFPQPPEGGFLVAGYSFGGSMAVEMVRVLEQRGVPVRGLYLIAPMPLDFIDLGPPGLRIPLQLKPLRKPVEELTTSEAMRIWARDHDPRTLRPYRYAWRWLNTKTLRHGLARLGRLCRSLGLPLGRRLQHRVLHADVRVERFRLHKRYRPGPPATPVTTPTVIFNAEENAETPGTDAAATWRLVFRNLKIVPTPDPHLDDEAVAAAKRVILDHLRDLP